VSQPKNSASYPKNHGLTARPAERKTTIRRAAADPGELMRTCPICSKELAERKCKLYCPDPVCGYYLSCSDFY